MHSIRINKVINQMISLFYRIGFWHRGEKATTNEQGFKALYCIYHFLFTISLAVTAITTEESDESVFLAEYSIIAFVLSVKLCVLIWNQKRILELLNQICVFSIRYDDDFTFINKKLKIFGDFVVFASTAAWFTGFCEAIVAPFIGSERTLFFKIAFPWDWKNNDIAYCVAYLFMFSEVFLSLTTASINILIWYLMFNCSLLYQVLGSELTKMGQIDGKKDLKISKKAKQHLYVMELNVAIDAHRHITEYIQDRYARSVPVLNLKHFQISKRFTVIFLTIVFTSTRHQRCMYWWNYLLLGICKLTRHSYVVTLSALI